MLHFPLQLMLFFLHLVKMSDNVRIGDCTFCCTGWMDKEIVSVGRLQCVCLRNMQVREKCFCTRKYLFTRQSSVSLKHFKRMPLTTDVFPFDLRKQTLSIPEPQIDDPYLNMRRIKVQNSSSYLDTVILKKCSHRFAFLFQTQHLLCLTIKRSF